MRAFYNGATAGCKRWPAQGPPAEAASRSASPGTAEQLAVSAAAAAVALGDEATLRAGVAAADAGAVPALLSAIGTGGSARAQALLESLLNDADASPEIKAAAVFGLGRSQAGAKRLVTLAEQEQLTGTLPQAAAAVIGPVVPVGRWMAAILRSITARPT